jgi:hypothetical protein
MQRPTLQTALLLGPQSECALQTQSPAEHIRLVLQLVEQTPQWELSVFRSTQVPSQDESSGLPQALDEAYVPPVAPPNELLIEPPIAPPMEVDVPPDACPPVSENDEFEPPKFWLPPIRELPPELLTCEPPAIIDDDCELDAPDAPPWVGSRVPPASVPPYDESPPSAVWPVPAFPEWAKLDWPPAFTVKLS